MYLLMVLCGEPALARPQPAVPRPEPSGAAPSGTSYVSPEFVTVNSKQTLEFHYVVGASGMAVGDQIRIEDPPFHGMTWAKYGQLVTEASLCTRQTDAQASSSGLLTAHASTGASVSVRRSAESPIGLNEYAYTDVTLDSDGLVPGDEVVVVYGDQGSGEDCGFEFSDRAWHKVPMLAWEALDGAAFTELATLPLFDVVSYDVVTTLFVSSPSQAIFEDGADLQVAVVDRLGNPIESWTGTISVNEAYGGGEYTLTAADAGVGHLHVDLSAAGSVDRILVAADDGSTGTSNPIVVYSALSPPEKYTYWGDLHTHHGHSYTTDEGHYVDENVIYARDVVGLDFEAESQKTYPIEIDGAQLWSERQDNCVGESTDGEFISMLGFEWMGDHVGGANQGHHNFYFDTCDAPLGALLSDDYPDGIGAFNSGQGPYEFATSLLSDSIHTVIVPHATLSTGYLYTNEAINNTLRTTAEVYSEWGFNMTPADRSGSIPDALRQGNRMGFIGSSDNHDGWLGNPFSKKNVQSGFAAIQAPALTRADLFGGLQQRSTYATTGERIVLDYSATDGAEIAMGQQYVALEPTFNWAVHGTQPVTTVTLFSIRIDPGARVETLQTWTPNALDATGSFSYPWDGADRAVWLEVGQAAEPLNGGTDQAWGSPIWLTADCAKEDTIDPATRCPEDTDSPPNDSDSPVVTDDSAADTADAGTERRCGCSTGAGPAEGGLIGIELAVVGIAAVAARRRRQARGD
ncbi:MAG: DUF3604 domain-containing protein [Myxococcales bacterium]|nr:DUF3604 domain-containing protein [Myxococcales bacterium]